MVVSAGLQEGDVAGVCSEFFRQDGGGFGVVGCGCAMKGDDVLSEGWCGG